MKLDLEKLAGYLPYKLEGKYQLKNVIIDSKSEEVRDKRLTTDNVDFFIMYCKPLLRPVSSLIKVIDVEGKSFIPIIELARLENGGGVFDYQIEKLLIEESGYIGLYYTTSTGLVEFSYDPKFMTFTIMLRHKDESYKCDLIVNHQLEMFQKLHEWHFDIYGLIDKGLAIAIED